MHHKIAPDNRPTEPKIQLAKMLAETMMHCEEAMLRCIRVQKRIHK